VNAALFAAQILARRDPAVRVSLALQRDKQTQAVLERPDPRVAPEPLESAPGSATTPQSDRRGGS
jgi:hypothetical protein